MSTSPLAVDAKDSPGYERRIPRSVHLALLSLLLPIALLLTEQVFTSESWRGFRDLTFFWQGVLILGGVVAPITGLLLVLVKGWWRIALVLLLGSTVLLAAMDDLRAYTLKKKGLTLDFTAWGSFHAGTEVYCNGVLLGTVPMQISVGELLEKLPRWKPPEQARSLMEIQPPLYTWIPWDGFLPERQKERRYVDPNRDPRELDGSCEFWWCFRYKGAISLGQATGLDVRNQGNTRLSFVTMPRYFSFIHPSKYPLFEILLTELEKSDYQPSNAWLDYVAGHGSSLDELFLRAGQPYRQHLEPVLDALARRRYGLSDTPTPEQCERAVATILEENRDENYFSTWEHGKAWRSHTAKNCFGDSYFCRNEIADRAIRQLGPNCKESLVRKRKTSEFGQSHAAVRDREALTCLWGRYPFSDCFEESVRYYARHGEGFEELMAFDDPRLAPLLQTMLRDRSRELLDRSENIRLKCAALIFIDNPILEPLVRDTISGNVKVFRYQQEELYHLLYDFIQARVRRPEYAKDTKARNDLVDWVKSFSLSGDYKRNLIHEAAGESWRSTPVYHESESIPPVTTTELTAWSEARPGESIKDFLVKKLEKEGEHALPSLLYVLSREIMYGRSGLEEGLERQILRLAWDDESVRKRLLKAIADFHSTWTVDPKKAHVYGVGYSNSFSRDVPGLTLPLLFEWHEGQARLCEFRYTDEMHRRALPGVLVPYLDELTEARDCGPVVHVLKRVETAEAEALLGKWSRSSDRILAESAEKARESLQKRLEFKRNIPALYEKIISGEIGPDDLLL